MPYPITRKSELPVQARCQDLHGASEFSLSLFMEETYRMDFLLSSSATSGRNAQRTGTGCPAAKQSSSVHCWAKYVKTHTTNKVSSEETAAMPDAPAPQSRKKLKFLPTAATFHLGEPLGVGTVGAVFRAESPEIDRPLAVKLLHPTIAHDERIVERFQREITIMERLNHPHIVRNYGGGLLDGQYFYAMELLNHGTLKQRLEKHGPLAWPQAAAYTAHIASALQHAHNHGIIHRDLKTSNLFFNDQGLLVLGDFGIAHDTHGSDVTGDGITVGTYAYMSPEQICADKEISGKADLYSLGCVLYEMLTGKPPFLGANFAQIWDQHLHKDPAPLQEAGVDCPEWLETLARQLLAKDPELRPFNARAVQGLIKEHLQDEFGSDLSELTQELPPLEAATPPAGPSWGRMLIGILVIGSLIAAAILLSD